MSTSEPPNVLYEYDYNKIPLCSRRKCEKFVLNDTQLRYVTSRLLEEIKKGLSRQTHAKANVKCYPTYVLQLPDVIKEGTALVIDFQENNFRILFVKLQPNKTITTTITNYNIPESLLTGPGKLLFDFVATCLQKFLTSEKLEDQQLVLGLTFDFPTKQKTLNSSILLRWTKGFHCDDIIGQDIVKLLTESIKEKKLKVVVKSISNRTTGAFVATSWDHPDTSISLTVTRATTNACYLEQVQKVETFDQTKTKKPYIIINLEWSSFGDNGCLKDIKTIYDEELDTLSENPGHETFDKIITGTYMGEIVRLVLSTLHKQGLFLSKSKDNSFKFQEPQAFLSIYVSLSQKSNYRGQYYYLRHVMNEMDVPESISTEEDLLTMRYVCECVSDRSAQLTAAGLAALIIKMKRSEVVIAVDGLLYSFHQRYADTLKEYLNKLIGTKYIVKFEVCEDGAGKGAALLAIMNWNNCAANPK